MQTQTGVGEGPRAFPHIRCAQNGSAQGRSPTDRRTQPGVGAYRIRPLHKQRTALISGRVNAIDPYGMNFVLCIDLIHVIPRGCCVGEGPRAFPPIRCAQNGSAQGRSPTNRKTQTGVGAYGIRPSIKQRTAVIRERVNAIDPYGTEFRSLYRFNSCYPPSRGLGRGGIYVARPRNAVGKWEGFKTSPQTTWIPDLVGNDKNWRSKRLV